MGQYRLTRHVKATPERVFEGFTDPAILRDWMAAAAVEDASGPLDRAATTYTLVIRGPWRFRSRVVRSEPPRIHETVGRGRLGAGYRMIATLTARGEGTDLDLVTEYTVPLGPIGRWIDRRWIDREPRTVANRELDRLVELVSATDDARSRAGAVTST
jgi:carbon monoxide dehydrogenase subunit G